MVITLHWWSIPTIITVAGLLWVTFHKDSGGYFSGLGNIFLLIPVLGVSLISWIIAAVMK